MKKVYFIGLAILLIQLIYLLRVLKLDAFSYFFIMFTTIFYGLCMVLSQIDLSKKELSK